MCDATLMMKKKLYANKSHLMIYDEYVRGRPKEDQDEQEE